MESEENLQITFIQIESSLPIYDDNFYFFYFPENISTLKKTKSKFRASLLAAMLCIYLGLC